MENRQGFTLSLGFVRLWAVLAFMLLSACVQHGHGPSTLEEPLTSSLNPAAQRLLSEAEDAVVGQNYKRAESLIERALRIEPRSPHVYMTLSKLRLAEGRYPAAVSMAKRGVSLLRFEAEERREHLRSVLLNLIDKAESAY